MATAAPRRRRTKAEMAKARRRSDAAFKANLKARHRMTVEQYEAIKAFQGGHCYLCPRTGTTKRLSVDHDHKIAEHFCDHPVNESCRDCWRGLLCSTCNKMFGHARDSAAFFERAALYIRRPPAQDWLDIDFDRADDREGPRTLRGDDSSADRTTGAADQVPCSRRQSGECQPQPGQAGNELSCMRLRRRPARDHHGQGRDGSR